MHFNNKYSNLSEAVTKADGLAVLGVFLSVRQTFEFIEYSIAPVSLCVLLLMLRRDCALVVSFSDSHVDREMMITKLTPKPITEGENSHL